MTQAQYSLKQQLDELFQIANESGLYDAADFIRNHIIQDSRRTWSGHTMYIDYLSALDVGYYIKVDYADDNKPLNGAAVTVREV